MEKLDEVQVFLQRADRLIALDLLFRVDVPLRRIRELFLQLYPLVRLGIFTCLISLIYFNDPLSLPLEQRFIAYFLLRDAELNMKKNFYVFILEDKRRTSKSLGEKAFLEKLLSEECYPEVRAPLFP